MADIFVSYKAEDRTRVAPLVRALESDGFSVWWDAHIGGGDEWRETIQEQLESARCVVVVWSKRSCGPEGDFVRDEATRAKRRGVYVPVLIDKVEPPLGFGESQILPLHRWSGDVTDARYRAVVEAIQRRIGRAGPAVPRPTAGRLSRRTIVLAGSSAAALAAAGIGAWRFFAPRAASASIAVLPFENLSGDPAQAYFSDGIAEELRSALARIAGLRVVARISSEAVRNDDAQTAARKLNVAEILTGSVRRSTNLIRISAQLVNGGDGTERWSQQYDRPTGDSLQIQSDIASQVASALAFQLRPPGGGRLTPVGTNNPAAHDAYLKGLAFRTSRHSAENMRSAIALFDVAVRLDPQYAEAYALKAQALVELGSGFAANAAEMRSLAAEAAANANRALALSPDLPSAHTALGAVANNEVNFAEALREFRKAALAAPGDALALNSYGIFLAQIGFAAEAHKIGARLIAIDPLSARSYVPSAQAYYSARRFAECVTAAQKLVSLQPGAPPALALLGDALVNLGRFDEARAAYDQISGDDLFRRTGEGIVNERAGNHVASAKAVELIEAKEGTAASYQQAQLRAQRGESDLAFVALNNAIAVPDPGLIFLLVDPFLDPIRSDPRFEAVRNKINFPAGLG